MRAQGGQNASRGGVAPTTSAHAPQRDRPQHDGGLVIDKGDVERVALPAGRLRPVVQEREVESEPERVEHAESGGGEYGRVCGKVGQCEAEKGGCEQEGDARLVQSPHRGGRRRRAIVKRRRT
eukprot:scaffold134569_cov37-Tisochrysis_lutea.AAC.1